MKSWILKGDVLFLVDKAEVTSASAEQIYSSVIEGSPSWQDLPAGKCGAAESLNFSRYPVDMFVALDVFHETNLPRISFTAQNREGASFPVSISAVMHGHVVHDTTWYPAAHGISEEIQKLLNHADYGAEEKKPINLRSLLYLKRAAAEGGPVIDRLTEESLRSLMMAGANDDRPEGIQADLYSYQLDGWRWLSFVIREQLGGLLADEMGLGKTLQVISALRDPRGKSPAGAALVIAPGSLLENWAREIRKFCPEFRTLKHHGAMRTGRPADLEGFDIVIASYDTAIRDLSLLQMIAWHAVILDEAQNIRNPDALRTKSVKQIARNVGLAVTGTPVENRLRDLWSIMDFVVPGHLGDLKDFEKRYVDDLDAATSLEPLVSPLILRRRVLDVASDLPERVDVPEILELSETEANAYDALRTSIYEDYGTAATLVSLGKLRQFCTHPDIIEDLNGTPVPGFSKFERLRELLEEIFFQGEKALVFTSYTKMADRIAEMASQEFGAMAETLDGRLEIDARQPLIDRFSGWARPAVLILNPRAGGSGLNITAANHVIHYNPEWNPALQDQASARAHRRGQERPVTVRQLIYAGTVEEVIHERLLRKRTIAEAAIVGVEGAEDDYADILTALERSPIADSNKK